MVEGDVFREVEEEMRRERMKELWDRFGVYVLGVAGLVVLLVAGQALYSNYAQNQAAEASDAFLAATEALDAETPPTADARADAQAKLEELAGSGPAGYEALARFRLAGEKLEAGDREAAQELLDDIAGASGADPILRDLAKIRAAMVALSLRDFTGVENRLSEFLTVESPWRHSARELVGLAALESGDTERAQNILSEAVIDTETPPSVRSRVQNYLELVIRADAKAPETASSEGGAAESAGGAAEASAGAEENSASDDGDATTN